MLTESLTEDQLEARRLYSLESLRWLHASALSNAHDTGLPCLKAYWLACCASTRRDIASLKKGH